LRILSRRIVYGNEQGRRGRFLSKKAVLNEQKNVVIYLVRPPIGERLEEISRQFGIAKQTKVTSAIEKMKREIFEDCKLRSRA